MDLINIYNEYHEKMSKIYIYRRDVASSIRNELREIREVEKRLEEDPSLAGASSDLHNMMFTSALTGEIYFFGQEEVFLEDRKKDLLLRKNKQYQWLLAESYEEFEGVVKKLYAFAGFKDDNFWDLSDYGAIKLDEIPLKSYNWFEGRVKEKTRKDGASYVLKRFRQEIYGLEEIEENNKLGVSLRVSIEVLKHFRHAIVHAGGVVEDKCEFKKKVVSKSGVSGSKKEKAACEGFIDSYFLLDEHPNLICVVEARSDDEMSIPVFYDVFEYSVGILMSYVDVLYTKLCNEYYD